MTHRRRDEYAVGTQPGKGDTHMAWSAIRRIGVGLGLATVVTLGIGCARARVEGAQMTAATLPRPARIIVFDFDTGAADVRVGSSPRRTARRAVGLYVTEADTLAQAVADTLATRLVDDIRARG